MKQIKLTYQEVRDFIVKSEGSSNKLIPWDKLVKEFGEEQTEDLLERGIIYEPVLGWAKLIQE